MMFVLNTPPRGHWKETSKYKNSKISRELKKWKASEYMKWKGQTWQRYIDDEAR
jgi:hypothetical protein